MNATLFPSLTLSSEKDEWRTPPEVFDPLNVEFAFDIDAAATAENALCSRYFTQADDGLEQDWGSPIVKRAEGCGDRLVEMVQKRPSVWVNPPYGRGQIVRWVRKAAESSDRATVVMLLPVDTSTEWFHRWVWPFAELRFLPERVRFVKPDGTRSQGAMFASMIAIYGR